MKETNMNKEQKVNLIQLKDEVKEGVKEGIQEKLDPEVVEIKKSIKEIVKKAIVDVLDELLEQKVYELAERLKKDGFRQECQGCEYVLECLIGKTRTCKKHQNTIPWKICGDDNDGSQWGTGATTDSTGIIKTDGTGITDSNSTWKTVNNWLTEEKK